MIRVARILRERFRSGFFFRVPLSQIRHCLTGMPRGSVFAGICGYVEVSDWLLKVHV